MSSVFHLHQKTAMLPVHNFLDILNRQYLLTLFVSDHVSHKIVASESGRRNFKQTLRSKCLQSVAHFLTNGTIPAQDSAVTLKTNHSEVVGSSANNLDTNRVLGLALPPIFRSEGLLSRNNSPLFPGYGQVTAMTRLTISTAGPHSLSALSALQSGWTEYTPLVHLPFRHYSLRGLQSLTSSLWGSVLSLFSFFLQFSPSSAPYLSTHMC